LGQRYYHAPEPSLAALSAGYASYVERDPAADEHLDPLLRALQALPTGPPADVDIVTWRGIMTRIMCTPYNRRDPWLLAVVRREVRRRRPLSGACV
jgi:RAT1-interacting protein